MKSYYPTLTPLIMIKGREVADLYPKEYFYRNYCNQVYLWQPNLFHWCWNLHQRHHGKLERDYQIKNSVGVQVNIKDQKVDI